MNKAVLIVDMSETCLDCRFCREIDEGVEACCEVMNESDDNSTYRMIDCKDGYCQNKPEWCPLQEMSETDNEWHNRDNYPIEHKWIIVKDKNGKEYNDHKWISHAYYEFVCNEDECDGWRSQVDIVSWKYDKEHK